MVRHGDYYYLFVSFDLCCRGTKSNYRTMVGRSSSITGPYLDAAGVPMLHGGGTALLTGNARWIGPGGESVLQQPDGDIIVFHAYDGTTGRPSLQIRRLTGPVVGRMLRSKATLRAQHPTDYWTLFNDVLIFSTQHGLHQIAQLLRREFVALDIGGEASLAVDQDGVEGMHQQSFLRVIIHIESRANALHFGWGSHQEMPHVRIGMPGLRVFFTASGRSWTGFNDDCEQDQIASHHGLDLCCSLPKLVESRKQ